MRWDFGAVSLDRHAARLLQALEDPDLPTALTAVETLGHPAFHPFGAVAALESAWHERHEEGPEILLGAILVALGESGDPAVTDLLEQGVRDPRPLVRMGAGEGLERLTGATPRGLNLPTRGDRLDPDRLRELGSEPRWILRTERGEIRIRLVPDQAPLTVLGIARLAASGAYDGVPFHRVIGGFVAQGGDVAAGDGTGQAGLLLPSEFTLLPFGRGVVGMASSGKDTEDSQFFMVHAIQPHLDGLYTAFGWVEEGADVMDRLLPGDLLLSSTVEPATVEPATAEPAEEG
jgi:cyclophilin family peptidyl-prolyl cis-trans isomerase